MRNFRAEYKTYSITASLILMCTLLPYPLALAEPGFWTIDSIDIPEVIQEKGGSVYQIIVLTSGDHEILTEGSYAGALSREKERLEADVKKPPTETPTVDLGRYYQILSSIDSGVEQGEIYKTIGVGTAFEAGLHPNVSSLWTSYPNVRELVEGYLESEGLRDSDKVKVIEDMGIPLNILLVDREGNVVFDTRIPGRSARLIDFAPGIGVVRVQLSETLGRPLVFSEHGGGAGRGLEDVYIMGFPVLQRDETNREDYYAYPLRRYDLSVTIGEIFQRPVHSRQGSMPRHIECDADSAPGMSGAPALNERGHVIGIFMRPTAFKVGSILTPANQIYRHFRD